MTIAARGAASASQLPPAGAAQSPTNRVEQVLVHHLLGNIIEGLTDRGGSTHPFPWTPGQKVRVGVLGVTFNPLPLGAAGGNVGNGAASDDENDDTGAAATPASGGQQAVVAPPVENRGVIGVDFVVASGVAEVELIVDVQFALYHPLVPAFSDIAAEAQMRAAAAAVNPRRRPTVPVDPTWTRDNRHVTFSIRVPVGADETEWSSQDISGGNPLEADASAAVATHYTTPDAAWKLTNNQTLPVPAAMGTEADFRQALNNRRDTDWQPSWPLPRLTVTTMPTVNGDVAVSVSITNARVLTDPALQDLAVYDTRMTVRVQAPGRLVPQRLGFADDDVRYAEAATVVGRGRGCVALSGALDTIVAETLPVHIQHHAQSTDHNINISFAKLASGYDPTLDVIGNAMRTFLRTWDFSAATGPQELAQLTKLRDDFEAEVERFELGRDLLRRDVRLGRAFTLANRTFAAAKGPGAEWRLFQLVFIVTELGALAGRENPTDPALRKDLDAVDVLWFPTGGGKTEAYLGLITVALFYDRLRDKHRGTTAWLLFPLRMLSVQQLARISEVVHQAEVIRAAEGIAGDPFTLGYLVGSSNTPNRLGYSDPNGWWRGIDAFSQLSPTERDTRRLVGACPACGNRNSVGLDTDLASQRLLHVCRRCGHVLPIHSSDEEVTRYQPAVVVSTVDKITSFARNGQLTSFNRGPRMRCPQHGWYTHKGCVAKDCTTDLNTHTLPTGFRDPTPALWIQDELHLVREELGVFAGHYHTLVAELAAGAGNERSKVIAATATIEQYEDQLSQVYGRNPRMFPVGGPDLRRSFYTEVTDDIRRLYLGVLPAGGGTVKVDLAAIITAQLVEDVHNLTNDPTPLIVALAAEGISVTAAEARDHLFNYELALAYVNSKAHGVAVHDDIHRLSEKLINAGSDRVRSEYLMGETTLGELAAAVAAIQDNTRATPRADRIRALVGTSVVSHGVDLDRLNFEMLAGMPPSYAHYIQATARAGRSHVGLVVSVFDRANRRETSMYQSFATTHAALERMVEPVPVNRFATRAVERTLPGIVCSLLWDETRNPAWPSVDEINTTRKFRAWWNTSAAAIIPHLKTRIERAYRCPVPIPAMAAEEQKLVDDALARWENVECQRMQQWQAEWLTDLFTTPAMTSLRDVDPPVEFTGGNRAQLIVARLHA
jgi:hypothetical protein